jgi:hypothetical protein
LKTCLRFESHGVRIAVTGDSDATLDAAQQYLPPLRTPLSEGRAHREFRLASATQPDGTCAFSLHSAGRAVASSSSLRQVLRALEWEVSLVVAQRARDRIFVHAGAVEWKGKALIVPGRSFSGKSTLVAQLVRAGCAYLSDEFAILDSNGACHAYPRSLSLRVAGSIEQRTAEELGGHTRLEPLPVGFVVVTRYRQGAVWQPTRLSAGEAAMALLQHTVAARARTREVLAVLGASIAGAEALAGVRGDAAQFVNELLLSRS